MESMDYWRLCEELSIAQAALLIAGEDPSQNANVENWDVNVRPTGYEAAKAALSHAVTVDGGSILATKFVPIYEYDINGAYLNEVPGSVDINKTIIAVHIIKYFLKSRGLSSIPAPRSRAFRKRHGITSWATVLRWNGF